ncbi:hypothetical protein KKD70_01735, partial [Patescibacteria group bacterium]|nr:hypothetical protein [Patescibacteria group bacterium]
MIRKSTTKRLGQELNTIHFLIGIFAVLALIIVARLFYLQILLGDYYTAAAAREHTGYTQLPAKRGEILVQDYMTGEFYTVAANATMDLVYVDPKLIPNKTLVASAIAETLFNVEIEREKDNQRMLEERREYKRTGNMEAYDRVKSLTDEELKESFYRTILDKVSRDIRPEILLSSD